MPETLLYVSDVLNCDSKFPSVGSVMADIDKQESRLTNTFATRKIHLPPQPRK